ATGLGILGVVAAGGIALAPDFMPKEPRLRPPGAVPEKNYLSMCIKCGQCLQVCPYDCIELEDVEGLAGMGTAYIVPEKRGCYLCKAFPCILACPTGALDHEDDSIDKVHMGMAVIKKPDACLAQHGKKVPDSAIDRIYDHTKVLTDQERKEKKVIDFPNDPEKFTLQKQVLKKLEQFRGKECTICADMCPFPNPDSAIGMVSYKQGKLPEIREACVGCGVCVELCPTNVIEIVPRATYKDIYGGNKNA
ncbi:MAG: 4Fe-4S dicluster domain-containing protein, partial [Epsilonproteobacteria bacterium]|nr:4Fe-4S dicluster domain-containing protein [Campylobacterota bacterium]